MICISSQIKPHCLPRGGAIKIRCLLFLLFDYPYEPGVILNYILFMSSVTMVTARFTLFTHGSTVQHCNHNQHVLSPCVNITETTPYFAIGALVCIHIHLPGKKHPIILYVGTPALLISLNSGI